MCGSADLRMRHSLSEPRAAPRSPHLHTPRPVTPRDPAVTGPEQRSGCPLPARPPPRAHPRALPRYLLALPAAEPPLDSGLCSSVPPGPERPVPPGPLPAHAAHRAPAAPPAAASRPAPAQAAAARPAPCSALPPRRSPASIPDPLNATARGASAATAPRHGRTLRLQ